MSFTDDQLAQPVEVPQPDGTTITKRFGDLTVDEHRAVADQAMRYAADLDNLAALLNEIERLTAQAAELEQRCVEVGVIGPRSDAVGYRRVRRGARKVR